MKIVKLFVLSFLAVATLSAHAEDNGTYTPKKKKKTAVHQTVMPAPEPAPAPAAVHQNMAGCGLGSLAIQSSDKWSQVGASLLNFTGFQSVAISFGTSNCTEDGVTQASREKEAFIEANYGDLRHEVASGSGEYLSSLASLYGCQPEALNSFVDTAKKSGAFSEKNPDAAASRLENSVKTNFSLAATCHS